MDVFQTTLTSEEMVKIARKEFIGVDPSSKFWKMADKAMGGVDKEDYYPAENKKVQRKVKLSPIGKTPWSKVDRIISESMREIKYLDGCLVNGHLLNGLLHDSCTVNYPKKASGAISYEMKFDGAYRNGLREGIGGNVTQIRMGNKFITFNEIGTYHKGKMRGKGQTTINLNNDTELKYSGEFFKSKFHGTGRLDSSTGIFFSGSFYKGMILGNGDLTIPSNASTVGQSCVVTVSNLGKLYNSSKVSSIPKLRSETNFFDLVKNVQDLQLARRERKAKEWFRLTRVVEGLRLQSLGENARERLEKERVEKEEKEHLELLQLAKEKMKKLADLKAKRRRGK